MRVWLKKMMDEPPKERSQMTKKDQILSVIAVIVDATIIGLLVYTILVNSCQICYTTNFGAKTFNQCSNVADIMSDGVTSDMEYLYKGEHPPKDEMYNLTGVLIPSP